MSHRIGQGIAASRRVGQKICLGDIGQDVAVCRSQRGSVFLGGLVLMSIMTVLGLALFELGVFENRLVLADTWDTRGFYLGDAGLQAGFLELKNGDGTNDFDPVFAGNRAVTLFTNVLLNSSGSSADGGYTVTATPVTGSKPNQIGLVSTGCIPAANPCPAGSAQSTVSATVQRSTVFLPIVGLNDVTMTSGGGIIDSYDSSQGCGSPPCAYPSATHGSKGDLLSNGTIRLDGTVKGTVTGTTNTPSNPDITINGTVTGNVTSGGTVLNGGTVSGTITQNKTSPPVVLDTVPNCGPPYTTAALVNAALTPTSAYSYNQSTGQLTIGNTATIAAGSFYCFGAVTINGVLNVNPGSAAVTIKADGQWKVQGGGQVNNNTHDASKLTLISSYGNDAGETNTGVTLSGGSNAYFTVVAPKTEVLVSGGGDIYGAVMGAKLTISGGSSIHVDVNLENPAFNSVPGGVIKYQFLAGSWRRCPNRGQSC